MTNAELAILSLVAERPLHGYEIEQVIQQRGMRNWTEVGFSSIYYLLKKLAQAGLVTAELKPAERGPARKVYQATPEGLAALRVAVVDALTTPTSCHHAIQLGLANLPALPRPEAVAALERYVARLTEQRAELLATWEQQKPVPYFVDAMFEHSLALLEAERAWVEDFALRLATHDP